MTLKGINPKQYVYDIADGYAYLTEANIRKFTPAELRELYQIMIVVEREIRGEMVEGEDTPEIKKKNMRLQRLYRTKVLIQNFAKPRKIPLC